MSMGPKEVIETIQGMIDPVFDGIPDDPVRIQEHGEWKEAADLNKTFSRTVLNVALNRGGRESKIPLEALPKIPFTVENISTDITDEILMKVIACRNVRNLDPNAFKGLEGRGVLLDYDAYLSDLKRNNQPKIARGEELLEKFQKYVRDNPGIAKKWYDVNFRQS